MKKVLAFTLVLVMLASVLVMPSFAANAGTYARPLGTAANSGVQEARYLDINEYKILAANEGGTSWSYRNLGENLTENLTSSGDYKEYTDANYKTDPSAYNLSAEAKARLANIQNGMSVIGVKAAKRPVECLNDGVWTTGNTTINGKKAGAGEWLLDGNYYNVSGNEYSTTPDAENGKVYTSLITYNFGETKTVNYLGVMDIGKDNNMRTCIQSADIYVSNDGENWTLHTYWDWEYDKYLNDDAHGKPWQNSYFVPNRLDANLLGADNTGKTVSMSDTNTAKSYVMMMKLGGVQAQYVRIAVTVHRSARHVAGTSYDHNAQDLSVALCSRDMLLIGGDAQPVAANAGANYLGRQTTAVEDGKFSTRYVATIDSLDYAKAGFEVKIRYRTGSVVTTGNTVTVYAQKAYKEIKQYGMENAVAADGEWFILFTLKDLSSTNQKAFMIDITPFTEDEAGVKTYGATYRETFRSGVHYSCEMAPNPQ